MNKIKVGDYGYVLNTVTTYGVGSRVEVKRLGIDFVYIPAFGAEYGWYPYRFSRTKGGPPLTNADLDLGLPPFKGRVIRD
jgi:hypothetical protein